MEVARHTRREALSLFEVIAVLSIVTILASLTLVGIHQARSTARRIQCQNSIRQVGLAVLNYESAYKRFPLLESNRSGALHALAAFLEFPLQLPERGYQYRVRPPFDMLGTPAILSCAADPESTGSNYRLNSGSGPYESNRFGNLPGGGNGPFNGRINRRTSSIIDGLSHTAMVSERCKGSGQERHASSIFGAARISGWPDATGFREACKSVSRLDAFYFSGRDWLSAGYGHTTYNHVLVPNSRIHACTNVNANAPSPITAAAIGPTSFHRSCNMVLCDGSVRGVDSGIDYETWQALGSGEDGSTLMVDWH